MTVESTKETNPSEIPPKPIDMGRKLVLPMVAMESFSRKKINNSLPLSNKEVVFVS